MKSAFYSLIFLTVLLQGCKYENDHQKQDLPKSYPDVNVAGAMKNVMWKGTLGPTIALDTILIQKGLYGLGPTSYLTGEILISDGKPYVSKVTSDATMAVVLDANATAPFFVYAHVNEWTEHQLPKPIKTIKDLESYIDNRSTNSKRPFAFKLEGTVKEATIHVQNLPEGTKVSSPKEAHQGQVTYVLSDETVQVIGFFSTEHQGVFTHHDTYLHMHLITEDASQMGHLDNFIINNLTLFLPKE